MSNLVLAISLKGDFTKMSRLFVSVIFWTMHTLTPKIRIHVQWFVLLKYL